MDNEQLVNAVTKIIMERLAGEGSCPASSSVVVFGDVPDCVLGTGLNVRKGVSPSDTDGADYIVLTQAAFRAFHGGVTPAGLTGAAPAVSQPTGGSSCCSQDSSCCSDGCVTDLSGKKVISERDVRELNLAKGCVVKIGAHSIVTALARDFIVSHGATIRS